MEKKTWNHHGEIQGANGIAAVLTPCAAEELQSFHPAFAWYLIHDMIWLYIWYDIYHITMYVYIRYLYIYIYIPLTIAISTTNHQDILGYGLGASGAGIDGFVELQRGAAVHWCLWIHGMCGDMLTQEPGHTIYYNIHMYKCIYVYMSLL